ncbi:unnamed protein product [Moneuplotes crassus]|uniref:Transcriptional coactivator p15 (PC4) C-terminal domain-containing protein n=1 Tax=Euplotes crassus TaxID=5936 RepID=A0AAD1XXH0_EUPCR|nr:unnamed protein product [Moneuplotes crassus]
MEKNSDLIKDKSIKKLRDEAEKLAEEALQDMLKSENSSPKPKPKKRDLKSKYKSTQNTLHLIPSPPNTASPNPSNSPSSTPLPNPPSSKFPTESDGSIKFAVTTKKFVKAKKFRGKLYVDFRNYFEKDGSMLPTKKGIALDEGKWEKLKSLMPEINDAVKGLL